MSDIRARLLREEHMIDRLINMLLWIDNAFTKTRDPVLAEYRNYQRHLIISGVLSVMGLFGAYLVAPSMAPSSPLQQFANQVATLSAWACFAVSLVAVLWFAWTTYRLWRFTAD